MSAEQSDDPRPARRRAGDAARLARIFGDTLPDTTGDERDTDPRDRAVTDDDWLRSQVPPHHS